MNTQKLYVELYDNRRQNIQNKRHYFKQHIINPLNMLPQDINKTQNLAWFPKTSEPPEYGSIVKLLRAKNYNGAHTSCLKVLTRQGQDGSFLSNCCIQNDLWFQLLNIPNSILKFKLSE